MEEKRVNDDNSSNKPEVLTNTVFMPALLREYIGRLVRIEFLIGTNSMEDRTGILEDVGASYVTLRSVESGNLIIADIFSIKFVIVSESPYYPGMGTDHHFQV